MRIGEQISNRWARLLNWVASLGHTLPLWLAGDAQYTWPPAEDAVRLAKYKRYQALYEGEHESVYVDGGRYRYDKHREYVTVNCSAEITDLLVDRLFGEQLRVTGPDGSQEWLDYLQMSSNFQQMLPQLATGVSYRGDGVLKVRYDETRRAVTINPISPALYFPEVDDEDRTAVQRATLGWVVYSGNVPYLFCEIHEPGIIKRKMYALHGVGPFTYSDADAVELASLEEYEDLLPEEQTGVDGMLIIHIANQSSDDGSIWGSSDYVQIFSLQGELNNRYIQRAEVQDKHADPWMYGPDLRDDKGVLKTDQKYIITERGENNPAGYITWDGNLTSVENSIADLKSDIIRISGFSPESFAADGGGAESGRALKLKQWRTASAVRRRQRIYGPAIQEAIATATALARAIGNQFLDFDGEIPVLSEGDITLQWQDGLPNDTMQEIEEAVAATGAGLLSRETAIRRLNPDMSDEQIDEEISRIDAETAANSVTSPSQTFLSTPEWETPTTDAGTGANA